jgi:hypothetical protein
MKLKVFMWQVFHDKLQAGEELKKRNWKGDGKCSICAVTESMDHIFFSCSVAKFIWICFKEALGWDRVPTSLQNYLEGWVPLGCDNYKPKLFAMGVFLWILWITRNKFAIEGVCPNSPSDVLYKILSYLQRWRVLLKGSEQAGVDAKALQIKGWLAHFQELLKQSPRDAEL